MIQVSTKARINGLQPEMGLVWMALYQASEKANRTLVITHIRDGLHSTKSLHYVGYALDADVFNSIGEDEIKQITRSLRDCLTPEFDVVVERRDGVFSHWHIEFQPKSSLGDRLYA